LTHACCVTDYLVEALRCARATIRYSVGGSIEIEWKNGRRETIPNTPYIVPDENHLDYFRYLRGESSRPTTMLKDCRPFVYLNDLAHISSGTIESLPPEKMTLVPHDSPTDQCLAINGIEEDFKRFLGQGIWPGTNGWGRLSEPPRVTPKDLPQLTAVVDAMSESAAPQLVAKRVGA
jgi:hypothetical protein